MAKTTFSGPVISKNGFQAGTSGTQITQILKGTVSVVVPAITAAASTDVTVTIAGAAAGDIVVVSPADAAMETDLLVVGAWASAANTVKIRLANNDGSNAATGSTSNWSYLVIKS